MEEHLDIQDDFDEDFYECGPLMDRNELVIAVREWVRTSPIQMPEFGLMTLEADREEEFLAIGNELADYLMHR